MIYIYIIYVIIHIICMRPAVGTLGGVSCRVVKDHWLHGSAATHALKRPNGHHHPATSLSPSPLRGGQNHFPLLPGRDAQVAEIRSIKCSTFETQHTELQHNHLHVEYPKLDVSTMDASSVRRPGSSKSAAEGPKYHGHSAPSDFLLAAAIQSTTLSIPALQSHCDYL